MLEIPPRRSLLAPVSGPRPVVSGQHQRTGLASSWLDFSHVVGDAILGQRLLVQAA
jgi:hypothetical protein